MDLSETMRQAFIDELTKIAGGMARFGATPVTMANAVQGKGQFMKGRGAKSLFAKVSAQMTPRNVLTAAGVGGALTLVGQHKGKKMLQDWQTGRQLRRQQEGR
jgi:hypothetical protein